MSHVDFFSLRIISGILSMILMKRHNLHFLISLSAMTMIFCIPFCFLVVYSLRKQQHLSRLTHSSAGNITREISAT